MRATWVLSPSTVTTCLELVFWTSTWDVIHPYCATTVVSLCWIDYVARCVSQVFTYNCGYNVRGSPTFEAGSSPYTIFAYFDSSFNILVAMVIGRPGSWTILSNEPETWLISWLWSTSWIITTDSYVLTMCTTTSPWISTLIKIGVRSRCTRKVFQPNLARAIANVSSIHEESIGKTKMFAGHLGCIVVHSVLAYSSPDAIFTYF